MRLRTWPEFSLFFTLMISPYGSGHGQALACFHIVMKNSYGLVYEQTLACSEHSIEYFTSCVTLLNYYYVLLLRPAKYPGNTE